MTWEWAFIWVLVFSGLCYLGLLAYLYLGLLRVGRFSPGAAVGDDVSVSVIVAARDEEETLPECLDALTSLDYPADLLELIVVDDNSSDGTAKIVHRFARRYGFIKYLRQEGAGRYRCPKKSALATGIEASRGEIIFVTDADCRPGPGWIKGMLRYFGDDVNLVCGYSPQVSASGLFNGLLSLWSFITPLIGAASTGWNNILVAAGRNMAYRRRAFDAVGGFDGIGHIVSGDDILLARRIQQEFPGTARFATDRSACVPSLLRTRTLKAVLNQAVRHNSRGPHLSWRIQAVGLWMVLFHLFLLGGLVLTVGGLVGAWGFFPLAAVGSVVALVLKVIFDRVVLGVGADLLGSRQLLRYQLPGEAIHLAAFPLFTTLGTFAAFRWRGRTSDAPAEAGHAE